MDRAGLIATGVGWVVAIAWSRTRQLGWALIAWVATFVVYLSVWQAAVSPEKVLLWVSIILALALAVLAARLWQMRAWLGAVSVVALVALAGASGYTHRNTVLSLTRDPRGREVIHLLQSEMPAGQVGRLATCPASSLRLWRCGAAIILRQCMALV